MASLCAQITLWRACPVPPPLVSGGNGSGLRIPLSCAFAVPYTHVRTAHKVSAAFVTASGATLMTPDPGAPLGPYQPGRSCGGLVQQDFGDFQKAKHPLGGAGPPAAAVAKGRDVAAGRTAAGDL